MPVVHALLGFCKFGLHMNWSHDHVTSLFSCPPNDMSTEKHHSCIQLRCAGVANQTFATGPTVLGFPGAIGDEAGAMPKDDVRIATWHTVTINEIGH